MKYHKIQTIYNRNPETKFKTLLEGQFSLPEFEYLADCEWEFTEKIDGTNIRVNWNNVLWIGKLSPLNLVFNGRTDNAQIPPFLLTKLKEMFTIDKFQELYSDTPMTIYGEGYGNKIQKVGKHYLPDGVDFICFDIKIGDYWLKRIDIQEICDSIGIDVVPVVDNGTLYEAINICSNGFDSLIGDCQGEGLVCRPKVEMLTRESKRIIAKIKCKDFR